MGDREVQLPPMASGGASNSGSLTASRRSQSARRSQASQQRNAASAMAVPPMTDRRQGLIALRRTGFWFAMMSPGFRAPRGVAVDHVVAEVPASKTGKNLGFG